MERLTTTPTRRAILTAAVAAPALVAIGTSATIAATPNTEWDRLVATYRACRTVQDAAGEQHDIAEKANLSTPSPAARRAFKEVEKRWIAALGATTEACAAIAAYPVQTLAALQEKVTILIVEFDGHLSPPEVKSIGADVTRLAAREA